MIRKIIHTVGTGGGAALLNLFIAILISRYLGAIGKGQQGLIITTITYILVFSNLVGGSTLVYLVPRYGTKALLFPSYLWSVFMGLAFYFILQTTQLIEPNFIFNVCLLSVISSFIAIHTNLLIGIEKVIVANFLGFIQPLLILLFLFFFFLNGVDPGIDSYFKALYFSFGLVFILSFISLKKYFKVAPQKIKHKFSLLKEMLQLGVLNQLAHIFQLLSFRMSYYWLGQVYSEAEVGIFSNGTSIAESVWLISRSISLVQYSRIVNMDDKVQAQKLTLNLGKLGFAISFIILLPMVFLSSSFYEFIFGEGFGGIPPVILTLAPGILFLNLNIIISHYFSGIGKYHINSISSFAGLLAAILLYSILIPIYGITGAGIASSISYIVTTICVIVFFKKETKTGISELFNILNFRTLRQIRELTNKDNLRN